MKWHSIPFTIILIFFLYSCSDKDSVNQNKSGKSGLLKIKETGKISVVTDYNSTNYFIYRGQPMGYQYELLQELADYLGVKVDVNVCNDLNSNFDKLMHGEYDLIASNLTITKERKELFDFTVPHSQSIQVLVQRKPKDWENMSNKELEARLIRNQLELAEKTIYVQKNSSHAERLRNLSDEIGDNIDIREVDIDVESLIEKVANGEIDYAVSDYNIAGVNMLYFNNIDSKTSISFPQNLAWAVSKGNEDLINELNNFLNEFTQTRKFKTIYKKYFDNEGAAKIVNSDYYVLNTGKISAYDKYIKEYSKKIEWDWRLLASLIYQESRFNPDAVSWAGAFGLMQLMPVTAGKFGVNENSSPVENINAGTKYIMWLDKRFSSIKNKEEKIKFILASYNIGYGHIEDARELAQKNGKNQNVWTDNVEVYLLKKSDPNYFNDPVVKYGYCRGTETTKFVYDIMDRYNHYKNLIEK